MNVSVCIATRGDIDVMPCFKTMPEEWEWVIWDNGSGECSVYPGRSGTVETHLCPQDVGPYGRFAAIQYASNPLIYVQDDDVVVHDPVAIVNAWRVSAWGSDAHVVCNMPLQFREYYPDSAMVGFGAAFHRDAPERAFRQWEKRYGRRTDSPLFLRESCRLFTILTPRILVDVPKTDREMASNPDRLWKQPDHIKMRDEMIDRAREIRDDR